MQESTDKKTILYLVTQSENGGVQRYIFDLATGLKNEFNIIVAFGEQGEKGELAARLKSEGVECFAIKHLKRSISPIDDFLALLEIIKLIKKIKPDIIHLNSSKISILGSIAKLFLKTAIFNSKFKIQNSKFIYTVHGWVFNEPLPKWQKLFYKYAEKLTAKFKDKLICVSEFDRLTAIKEKICDPKKLITIHNGIAPINFLSKDEARQKLFLLLPNYNILIGTIANLYKTKGLEYLIQAANIIKEKSLIFNSCARGASALGGKFLILIIGEGPERKNLEQLIKRCQLQNNIILAGRIDNAAELLPAFDIYACSSVKEGLSYTLIEAMRAGLPIAATDVGGNPELIEDEKTGLLMKPKNPQILAEKIIRLINNPDLSRSLGANAKQKVGDEFGLETMVERTKKVYLNN